MNIRPLAALAITLLAFTATAQAESFLQEQASEQDLTNVADSADDRLLIVNGSSGHVIYDDGKDDLFCVTRKVVVGYNEWGYPIRKRTMHCR